MKLTLAFRRRIAVWIVLPLLLISIVIQRFLPAKQSITRAADTASPIASVEPTIDKERGLSFLLDPSFVQMEVSATNKDSSVPIYNFQSKDEQDVTCSISQVVRQKKDKMAAMDLVGEAFDQVKKNYPDAVLKDWHQLTLKSGTSAGWMTISYTVNKTSYTQLEIVATTDARTTFVFCKSPQSKYPVFQARFEAFLVSLSVQ